MELDMDYAALKLMEILFERELINYQTLQAAKEMVKDALHISQAAWFLLKWNYKGGNDYD